MLWSSSSTTSQPHSNTSKNDTRHNKRIHIATNRENIKVHAINKETETTTVSPTTITTAQVPKLHDALASPLSGSNATEQFAPSLRPKLRLDWSNLPPQSEIAKRLYDLQNNCTLPFMTNEWRPGAYGIGSDVHVWGNQLWGGLLYGHRVKTDNPWIWIDPDVCGGNTTWHCYFPAAEPSCPVETFKHGRIQSVTCGKYVIWPETYEVPEFRAAATEFLFSSISRVVIEEAGRQIQAVFGDTGVPPNLITVHVRWGDKALEGSRRNNPIRDFVSAVKRIVVEKNIDSVHVLLCTEDPIAVNAFRNAADPSWTIYLDHFYTQYLPYRKDREVIYNVPSLIAMELKGKPGLWALGSLLVAMEANYFVMTTKSNWARVMNELRKNVVDPRCGGCTYMVDLEAGEC